MGDLHDERIQDADLVKRAAGGDSQAFGDLFERYSLIIYRFLCAQLSDPYESENLTSEVFLRAWRSLPAYRERGYPFSTYLFRIARNAVIDQRRKARFRISPLDQADLKVDEVHLPSKVLARNQELQQLQEGLLGLNEVYRSVLVLRFLVGLSTTEVAEIMGRSEGATRVLQHRALKTIKKLMKSKEK